MISANGVEYKNLPEQVQYLTEKAAEFAVELDTVSASVESVTGDVAALQTSYTTLAEDVRVAKININSLFTNVGTAFSEIANIKNGTTHLFENITDSAGNMRFVEGNLLQIVENIAIERIYGKWSLSGTHLLMVFCFTHLANKTLVNGAWIARSGTIPSYILNKIVPINGNIVGVFSYHRGASNTSSYVSLIKTNDARLVLVYYGESYTPTADEISRIQVDLLIDAS